MKIKSIAAICKKNKQVVLFNRYSDSGTLSQYIGDGNAVYPISGLPELDEESILTIFDVPEKQRKDRAYHGSDVPCIPQNHSESVGRLLDLYPVFNRAERL